MPLTPIPVLDNLVVAERALSDFRWDHSDSWEKALRTQRTGGCINRRDGLNMVAKKKTFILPGLYPGFAVTLPIEL